MASHDTSFTLNDLENHDSRARNSGPSQKSGTDHVGLISEDQPDRIKRSSHSQGETQLEEMRIHMTGQDNPRKAGY